MAGPPESPGARLSAHLRVPSIVRVGPAAVAVSVASSVLLGWIIGSDVLKSVVAGQATMKANTAVCLLLLGVALLVRRLAVRWLTTVVVLVLAGGALVEYVFGLDLGLDQLLFVDTAGGAGNPPGRMAVATAVCLLVLATAGLLADLSHNVASAALSCVAFVTAWTAVLGYLYGVEALYVVVAYTTMAVHTAVSIAVLAVATLATSQRGLFAWLLVGQGPGAVVMRRLTAIAVAGLPVLGSLRLAGERWGWYGTSFGLALMVAGSSAVIMLTGVWLSRRLDAADAQRESLVEELSDLNATLVEGRDAAWRRAESLADELQHERDSFSRALSQIDDFVWTVELRAGRTSTVYTSPNGSGVFGHDLDPDRDLLAQLAGFVHPDDRATSIDFLAAARAGSSCECELRMVGRDGLVRWAWVRAAVRTEHGRQYLDGIATNVTERRFLQEQRERLLDEERAQRVSLEEVQAMRDEFLAVAGHELRTPITAIRGHAELMSEEGGLNEAQERAVTVIGRRSLELQRLVGDLFDLARLRVGIPEFTLGTVLVDDVVAEAVGSLEPQARESQLRVVATPSGTAVHADTARLRQILDNLLTNAFKYTPAGGSVLVSAENLGLWVEICVSDTGIGVAPDDLPLLFDKFFRAGTATARQIPGTGLGLAITKELVEAQGGSIRAEANPDGVGSSFTLRLPAVRMVAPTEVNPPPQS